MRHLGFFTVFRSLFWITGCKQDGDTTSPSTDRPLENVREGHVQYFHWTSATYAVEPTKKRTTLWDALKVDNTHSR